MLEEALSSSTFPPADTALALLSYVRYELPAGGANAEARFFRLYSLLCDRVFGPMSEAKDGYRHEVGGWLSRASRWNRPQMSTSRSPIHAEGATAHSSSQSIDSDPVVQLLAGIEALPPQKDVKLPTLIEAISAEAQHRPGIRYPFPLHALPEPTQRVVMALVQASMGGKPLEDGSLRDNAVRLFGSLLLVSPQDQASLKAHQQRQALQHEQKRQLSLSPGLSLTPTRASPTSTSVASKVQGEAAAKIMLSMLEFYLFTFFRYPLATPLSGAATSSTTQSPSRGTLVLTPTGTLGHQYRRPSTPYGEQVYLHLFKGYLKHFLPMDWRHGPFIGFPALTRESELFVRIAIELWFEGSLVIPTNSKALEAIEKRRTRTSAGNVAFAVTLASSYDLLDVKIEPPPLQVQRCLRILINHMVKHPDVGRAAADLSEMRDGRSDQCCLSPSMTIMQLPFYNYIRVTFRYASVHTGVAAFQTAFDSWLIWLEPWNVEIRKMNATLANAKTLLASKVSTNPRQNQKQPDATPVIVLPRPGSLSRYSTKWEPYVAANLYLYTVPLAIFLRRARELDFSPKEFRRSLTLVQRVFRVFSPEIVRAINSLLLNKANPLASTVARHEKVLGDYSPSTFRVPLSLESCQGDMHNLLEEIYSMHMKALKELDLFDKLASYLGLGEVTTGEEREMKALVDRAKVIVNFPEGYQVLPAQQKHAATKSVAAKDERGPERQSNGLLTENGVKQLVIGSARCTSLDFVPEADQLHSRPKSYEIRQLVPLTINASEWINEKIGLGTKTGADEKAGIQWFCINLRFLADYRTILWLVFLGWLWRLSH